MRCRSQDANGDYQFGRGQSNFLVNSPALVAQLILNRLKLMQGEWFLDKTIGTPWTQSIVGSGTKPLYDLAIQNQILNTQGVTDIENYSSSLDPVARKLNVTATVNTQFGQTAISTVI
jgi:hypothetical protein